MKRFLAGVAIALLLFPVGVAAKVVTVINPMATDLDGGGYSIGDVNRITTDGSVTIGSGVLWMDANHNRPSWRWGTEDPRTDPRATIDNPVPGSLFSEFAYNASSLWVKTGPLISDWQRVVTEAVP